MHTHTHTSPVARDFTLSSSCVRISLATALPIFVSRNVSNETNVSDNRCSVSKSAEGSFLLAVSLSRMARMSSSTTTLDRRCNGPYFFLGGLGGGDGERGGESVRSLLHVCALVWVGVWVSKYQR